MRFIHRIGPVAVPDRTIDGPGVRLVMAGPDSSDLLNDLHVGDRLTGRVTEVLDSSRVLMNFRGRDLIATTTFPMTEGEQIRGVVHAKGPPLILRIISEHPPEKAKLFFRFKSLASHLLADTKDHPALRFAKASGAPEGNWTKPLTRWLADFAIGAENSPDPDRVRAALTHGGMFYERKIRQWFEAGGRGDLSESEIDLKGAVLKLLNRIGSHGKAASISSEKTAGLLESVINRIELFQTANWLAHKEGLGFIFQIPLRFEDDLRTADLLINLPHQKRGKRDELRILILLDLGSMGHIQIEANMSRKGVTARIGVDQQETVALIRDMVGELKNGLESHQLTVLGIECFLLEKPIAREDFFQQLLTLGEADLVDIRV